MPIDNFILGGHVTGIGSLPHLDPEAAVRFVAEFSPKIPFWPQLPQRLPQDDMLLQMLAPLTDLLTVRGFGKMELHPLQLPIFLGQLRSVAAGLDPQRTAGFFAFERACAGGAFADAHVLKGQIYGPLTLARCLYVNQRPLSKLPGLYAALTDYLGRLAVWQIERLRRFGKPVLLFVDEPALALERPDSPALAHVRQLLQTIQAAGAANGIHCCAAAHPATLVKVAPDIISFDAHQHLEGFLRHPSIQHFVATGGGLALGLIPTLADLRGLAPDDLFARWVGAAVGGDYNLDQLAAQSLITATCGLGLLTETTAATAFWQSTQVAHKLRQEENTVYGY
ncbi:MAG: hypothetical protein NT075_20120 [Chloroflexi bacterium]|nr:hypothetical protein [Chloroflexota bacterium]